MPGAFSKCTALVSITIGSSVQSIGKLAFDGCLKLVEVINKSSLTITIGSTDNGSVAYNAKNVISNPSDTKIITSEDYVFYNDNGAYYLMGYNGSQTELIFPSDINGNNYEVYNYAFYENDKNKKGSFW